MTKEQSPGIGAVVVTHGVVEVSQGRAAGSALLVTPAVVETHDRTADHAEREEAVTVADAAVILACCDIEARVQTSLDAPIMARHGEEFLRREVVGREAAQVEGDLHARPPLFVDHLTRDLGHSFDKGEAEGLGLSRDEARTACFDPAAIGFASDGGSARWRREHPRGKGLPCAGSFGAGLVFVPGVLPTVLPAVEAGTEPPVGAGLLDCL